MYDSTNIISSSGSPTPLGANSDGNGVNFALFSSFAKKITLGLFSKDDPTPFFEIPLKNSNSVWHVHLKNLPQNIFYAYKIGDNWVLDPYAKELNTSTTWAAKPKPVLGKVFPNTAFDWGADTPLHLPFEELIIYEMHIRSFTQDKSASVQNPGTFLGLIERIPHLKNLGINAVELLPIFEFQEQSDHGCNYWGYSTRNFFSPMARYGTIHDFKTMVKALHEEGIEVILDVVFNHIGESSFTQIDKETYFILNDKKEHTNYTGCGNTVNCNDPTVIELILSSLCYFVLEMHVDGFRFDLASIFYRNGAGEVLKHPPLIHAINENPILSKTKLIAEAWDSAGLYQVGSFDNRFAEWNGQFRDITRRFLKGSDGQAGAFASVMSGSEDLYGNGRSPYHSINFITAHDGFSLRDLVSYNNKHNEANNEENKDGNDCNESWNCGVEGPTDDPTIISLRERQIRNFLTALALSIGTPMFLMGDEYGHTRDGNNNTYCQDNEKNYFLWHELHQNEGLHELFQQLIDIRKNTPALQRTTFPTHEDIIWHGHNPNAPDWSPEARFIAYTLQGHEHNLYIAFNAHFEPANLTLPPPFNGKKWKRLIDTALIDAPQEELDQDYYLAPHAALVLQA